MSPEKTDFSNSFSGLSKIGTVNSARGRIEKEN